MFFRPEPERHEMNDMDTRRNASAAQKYVTIMNYYTANLFRNFHL